MHGHEDYSGAAPGTGTQRPGTPAGDQGRGTPDLAGPDPGRSAASGTPDHGSPDRSAPDSTAPDSTAPDSTAPDSSAPDSSAPGPGRAGRVSERKPITAGRNLLAATAVGLALGALVLVTLFTVKATFLAYVGIVVIIAIWELSRALGTRGIRVPLLPVIIGGAAMYTLAYWFGARAALAATGLSVVGLMAWRLRGGVAG